MKNLVKIMPCAIALMLAINVSAQRDKSYILKHTQVEKLEQMAVQFAEQYRIEHGEAIRKALEMGWDTINLMRIDEFGRPEYWVPTNEFAAGITNTTPLIDDNIRGQNMEVGMWEASDPSTGGYAARSTHQDLTGRVTLFGNNSTLSSHATHVAGTLIGRPPSGTSTASRGMAPQATLKSYGLANTFGTIATEAAGGMLISNHSYGLGGGWVLDDAPTCAIFFNYKRYTWRPGSNTFNINGDDPRFGNYDGTAIDYDNICFNAPFYLPVFAAGNWDNENPGTDPICHDVVRPDNSTSYVNYDPTIHPKGNASQPSSIASFANAKNILTVGSVDDDGATKSDFSSRGQTDDGRIKPDIYGNGRTVYSAESAANNAYGEMSGTSMAAPNVAGSLLLLQQFYEDLRGGNGMYMRSATLKALALHTATDLGNPGPDYTYGWGLLNTGAARDVLIEDSWILSSSNAVVIEDSIVSANPSDAFVYEINASGTEPLKVTLVYTDPVQGAVGSNPALVNDLDLIVDRNSPPGNYLPYVLNPANPNNNATTGDNDRDNVEQVHVSSPSSGLHTISVEVEGTLANNAPQHFSLIISGLNPTCHANIQHKTGTDIVFGTYTANNEIKSQATILPGLPVTYQAGERVILQPGFQAKQTSSGPGFFKTAMGTCN